MSMRDAAWFGAILLLSGCQAPPLQSIDEAVATYARQPYDIKPAGEVPPAAPPGTPDAPATQPPPASQPGPFVTPRAGNGPNPAGAPISSASNETPPGPRGGIVLASYAPQAERPLPPPGSPLGRFELSIPEAIPGSETPLVRLPNDRARRPEAARALYPDLPPPPEAPIPLPGPEGRPYTLADLQRIAAANSPTLRQAASDVEAARGTMIQAGLYPNPTVGYSYNPNANNTASTTLGGYVDQVIKTGGKLKLQTAAGLANLRASELALKRARYDLATTIRGDYYTLLVARENVRVNKALVRFTDEIFRFQADLLGGGFAASHEPAALRSQAFTVRLAYKQSIANYIYAWKELVADMGLKQLPLSEVEGQVDRFIPDYDYDALLAYVLRNHTDVITARYNLEGARYGLKLARVTPAIPDLEVNAGVFKEHTVFPLQNYFQITVSMPLAVFDRNQGGIRAASAGLVRAAEQPHAVEANLTMNLATAYANYKNNLSAVDYYRQNILPDQVRYYRGVFERRKVDPTAAFGDLVQAQQVLVSDVSTYLSILNSLWSSVVSVADYLQTDDLFQVGGKLELPQLPDFDALHPLPCPHPERSVEGIGPFAAPAVPEHPPLPDPAAMPASAARAVGDPATPIPSTGAAELFARPAEAAPPRLGGPPGSVPPPTGDPARSALLDPFAPLRPPGQPIETLPGSKPTPTLQTSALFATDGGGRRRQEGGRS